MLLENLVLGYVQNPAMTAIHYRVIGTFALFIFVALVTFFVSNKTKRAEKFERDIDQAIKEEQLAFRDAKQDIRKEADRESREIANLNKSIEYYNRKILEVDLLAAKKAESESQNNSNRKGNGNYNNGNRNNGNNGNNGNRNKTYFSPKGNSNRNRQKSN